MLESFLRPLCNMKLNLTNKTLQFRMAINMFILPSVITLYCATLAVKQAAKYK